MRFLAGWCSRQPIVGVPGIYVTFRLNPCLGGWRAHRWDKEGLGGGSEFRALQTIRRLRRHPDRRGSGQWPVHGDEEIGAVRP